MEGGHPWANSEFSKKPPNCGKACSIWLVKKDMGDTSHSRGMGCERKYKGMEESVKVARGIFREKDETPLKQTRQTS